MEIDETTAQQLLRHAERQTKALENIDKLLFLVALVWAGLAALALILWVANL